MQAIKNSVHLKKQNCPLGEIAGRIWGVAFERKHSDLKSGQKKNRNPFRILLIISKPQLRRSDDLRADNGRTVFRMWVGSTLAPELIDSLTFSAKHKRYQCVIKRIRLV
jgi:hypothetical protein